MLSSLTISNVALIKKETLDFHKGFNCLLGQSGAGKSIIIDALSFCLGAKSDKNLIRSGETSMRVDAVFVDVGEDVKQFLTELEIDYDDELIISRTLSVDGKSSLRVNGFPVAAKLLKNLTEILADFCGQHDSVGLLNVNNHLSILDKFIGKDAENAKNEVGQILEQRRELDKKIASLGGDETERERTKELLSFQIKEIADADLAVGEEEELKERFAFISSAERIFEVLSDCLLKLDERNPSVTGALHDVKGELSEFSDFKDICSCRERIENCYYEIKDVVDVLNSIKDNTDFDPKELERIDGRLDLIKSLSRKYGKTVEDILNYQKKITSQLEELENSEEMLAKLGKERCEVDGRLQEACKKLSGIRKAGALEFEKLIMAELADLQMSGTHFKVGFAECEPTKNGADDVKFMFSANVGQEVRDLHKTASGGELSRLLLAFKNVMRGRDNTQTIIFDEIDAGISGHTAGKLAEKLFNISKYTQIICITHTPVVASRANKFLLVEKRVVENQTISSARPLEGEEIAIEIARLIDGSKDVSQTAIDHAKKLLKEALK